VFGISVHVRDETLDLSMQMGPISLAALTRFAHLAAYKCLARRNREHARCQKIKILLSSTPI
jgi:hypothetical protein